jgi:23S rRNA (uracil1939-C5)-methyltransferase
LHPKIGGLLNELAELIQGLSIYNRLPQIEVALGDTDAALSFRVLDPPSADDKAKLVAFGQQHGMQIYLQPKGPETTSALWPQDAVLRYSLPAHAVELSFMPQHFTQVNLALNRQMVDRALHLLAPERHERVLDLFCGLGNFGLPLARYAGAVVGVEGEAGLVEWAKRNAARNGLDNVFFHTADLSGDIDQAAWLRERYDKALLDPPRSGALAILPPLAKLGLQKIVYVSCHPATLARDAGELVHRYGYRLHSAGVMDMFPHAAHIESIALFERHKK